MSATSDWVTVGALADGFMLEAYLLPHVEDFAGKTQPLTDPDLPALGRFFWF